MILMKKLFVQSIILDDIEFNNIQKNLMDKKINHISKLWTIHIAEQEMNKKYWMLKEPF